MYQIWEILSLIVRIIPAAALIMFAYRFLRRQQPLQWRESIKNWARRIPYVLAITLIGGIVFTALLWTGRDATGSFKMGYNYAQASKGLTPNGVLLDEREVLSDEVLGRAIQAASLDVEIDTLRNALEVTNVQQNPSLSMEDNYISTEYRVIYRETEQTKELDSERILTAVAEAYQNFFAEKYGRKTNILAFDASELEDLDYLDVTTYLQAAISNLVEYMDMCRNENSTFVSQQTGESFATIRGKALTLRDVSLERYNAFVLKYGLSKDRQQYIAKLNYENRMTNVRYMKSLSAYNVRLAAIDRYDEGITTAVLVPTRDEDGEFYQSRTKLGTDYFADEANDYLASATDRQLEIETNNYYIESLAAGLGQESEFQKADEMIVQITDEIARLNQLAAATVEEFDTKNAEDYITVSLEITEDTITNVAKSALRYMAVIFVVWSAVAAVYEKRAKKTKNNVIYSVSERNNGGGNR